MGEISVGPEAQPAIGQDQNAPDLPGEVDAQHANEEDTRHGLAGAESKPFSGASEDNGDDASLPHHRPGDSQSDPDEPNDMISGRRNAGRDDASDAPAEPPAT